VIDGNVGSPLFEFGHWIATGSHHLAHETVSISNCDPRIIYKASLLALPCFGKARTLLGRQTTNMKLLDALGTVFKDRLRSPTVALFDHGSYSGPNFVRSRWVRRFSTNIQIGCGDGNKGYDEDDYHCSAHPKLLRLPVSSEHSNKKRQSIQIVARRPPAATFRIGNNCAYTTAIQVLTNRLPDSRTLTTSGLSSLQFRLD
jgi:hypothetical protein